MSTIKELLDAVAQLNLREQVPIIIENTAEEIIKLNQAQLYFEGVDVAGKLLRAYADREYSLLKESMNPSHPGIPDLNLTGAFYRGFYVEVIEDEFNINSMDSKTDEIEELYEDSAGIFGLTEASLDDYANNKFLDAFLYYVYHITGLDIVQ